MAEYSNEMRGVLFINKEKDEMAEKADTTKWADRKGSCEINGVKYWISGWLKESKNNGEKFMSLSFEEAKPKGNQNQSRPTQNKAGAPKAGDPF